MSGSDRREIAVSVIIKEPAELVDKPEWEALSEIERDPLMYITEESEVSARYYDTGSERSEL